MEERHFRSKTLSTLPEDAFGEESRTETSKCSQVEPHLLLEEDTFKRDLIELRKESETRDEMLLSTMQSPSVKENPLVSEVCSQYW